MKLGLHGPPGHCTYILFSLKVDKGPLLGSTHTDNCIHTWACFVFLFSTNYSPEKATGQSPWGRQFFGQTGTFQHSSTLLGGHRRPTPNIVLTLSLCFSMPHPHTLLILFFLQTSQERSAVQKCLCYSSCLGLLQGTHNQLGEKYIHLASVSLNKLLLQKEFELNTHIVINSFIDSLSQHVLRKHQTLCRMLKMPNPKGALCNAVESS